MIHFEWLWAFLFLPFPVMVYFLMSPKQASFAALKVPFYNVSMNDVSGSKPRGNLALVVAALAWCLLLISSARPQWVGEPVRMPLSGRDLMLAVDLSESMKQRDMLIERQRVNRLQAVQSIAGEFIERRQGDRIGLILFGSEAYLQSPLTLDRRSVSTLLREAVIGIAGPKTAIGNAVALAAKRLSERESSDKVLILLTDGENTAGNISPKQAAALAKSSGLKVYTIGIGEVRQGGFFRTSGVDEASLKQIAQATGGRYFRAQNTQDLEQIYALIDELETVEEEAEALRPVKELFYWPAALAFCLVLLLLGLRHIGRAR